MASETAKKIFFFSILIFFNAVVVLYLDKFTDTQLSIEMIKWSGFASTVIIAFFAAAKINAWFSYAAVCSLYLLYFFLTSYYSLTHAKLDFAFFSRNAGNVIKIIPTYAIELSAVVSAAIVVTIAIHSAKNAINARRKYILPAAILVFIAQFFLPRPYENEFLVFAKSIYSNDAVIDSYQKFYASAIDESSKISTAKEPETKPPDYLDNIIIVHIESLNAKLVSERVTPNFLEIAEQGILLPEFYGNSVQTILAQENTLCSLPTSFDTNLVNTETIKNVRCLPRLLKELGYRSFFAKTFDLRFAKTGEFMSKIGFDEVHSDDIMKKSDPLYVWGWREDVFLERAFDSFKKTREKKNLIYLEMGPTHHWPFNTPPDRQDDAINEAPDTFGKKFETTLNLQDSYLKDLWDRIQAEFPEKNFTLIISGDHSFPYGTRGKDFVMSEHHSFEENFLTSCLIVFGNDNSHKGKIIRTRYSELDILPTIMDFLGQPDASGSFSRSIARELSGLKPIEKPTLLIQPFSTRYINIVHGRKKLQYDGGQKKLIFFDLDGDPNENNPVLVSSSQESILKKLNRYFTGPQK